MTTSNSKIKLKVNKKYILPVELNGDKYTLLYTLGLPNYLDELFGYDLIEIDGDKIQEQISSGSKLFKFISAVVWSGIANHADQVDEPHPLTIEQLKKKMNGLDPKEGQALAVAVLQWIFTCVGVPAAISEDSGPLKEDGEKGERFHVEKTKAVRTRGNGFKRV